MSRTYSIKEYHVKQLRALRNDIVKGMSRQERKALDETKAALDEWQTWKTNCKPLKGTQKRLV